MKCISKTIESSYPQINKGCSEEKYQKRRKNPNLQAEVSKAHCREQNDSHHRFHDLSGSYEIRYGRGYFVVPVDERLADMVCKEELVSKISQYLHRRIEV